MPVYVRLYYYQMMSSCYHRSLIVFYTGFLIAVLGVLNICSRNVSFLSFLIQFYFLVFKLFVYMLLVYFIGCSHRSSWLRDFKPLFRYTTC